MRGKIFTPELFQFVNFYGGRAGQVLLFVGRCSLFSTGWGGLGRASLVKPVIKLKNPFPLTLYIGITSQRQKEMKRRT